MTTRPFFSYYGGKWRDARKYPAPTTDTIIEPFAGSAGYALRYPHLNVLLIDANPTICELWQYLISANAEDIVGLPDLQPGQTTDDLDIPAGAKHLIGFWLNRGASAPRKQPSKWMRAGNKPTSFWGEQTRKRIADQIDRINHWKVICGDYTSAPNVEATWFVDPPYQHQGVHYRYSSKLLDYGELAKWCSSRAGQVIVCEQAGANWLPFAPLAATKTCRKEQQSFEAIWSNQRECDPNHTWNRITE